MRLVTAVACWLLSRHRYDSINAISRLQEFYVIARDVNNHRYHRRYHQSVSDGLIAAQLTVVVKHSIRYQAYFSDAINQWKTTTKRLRLQLKSNCAEAWLHRLSDNCIARIPKSLQLARLPDFDYLEFQFSVSILICALVEFSFSRFSGSICIESNLVPVVWLSAFGRICHRSFQCHACRGKKL